MRTVPFGGDAQRPTIYTTPMTPERFRNAHPYDTAMVSRLSEWVEIVGEDKRQVQPES